MVSITGNWSGQRLVAAGCNAPSWGINRSEQEKILYNTSLCTGKSIQAPPLKLGPLRCSLSKVVAVEHDLLWL